ncbi:MAG: NAD(P)/FAD-dependent oxidoreductase [Planctomycetota bacterium]
MSDWDLGIVGGGAAGLAAGIFAAEANPKARVVVFDGARKVGAKILVAGGGRCNVTHHKIDARDYNAATRNFVKNVLASFTVDDTIAWLGDMGVELKREPTGKLFPTTDKARTVLDALLTRLADRGATLLTEHRVTSIDQAEDSFVVRTPRGEHQCRRVVLCSGGRSLPRTGSDGGGYVLARHLGHTVGGTHEALVSMTLQQHFFHGDLAGISHEAEITTTADGKPVDRRRGSLLWTHFGVSGPLAMDASRHWLANKAVGREVKWYLNLLPDETFESVEQMLLQMAEKTPKLPLRSTLKQWAAAESDSPLPEKVSEAVLWQTGVDDKTPLAQVRRDDRRKLVHALTNLELPVEQARGWNHAEVTAGGVPLSEVAWKTMSSRVTSGLHLAGEILDVDGRIGGFNFQWAWATGYLAGRAGVSA